MPGTPFSTTTYQLDGDPVLALHGDIDRGAQQGLEQGYRDAKGESGRLLLDFGDVDYINSTGIALIVGVLADARASGHQVAAFGLSEHYREIFAITRLSDFMAIYEDQDAATASH